jgi:LysM repeat protein
VLRVPAPDQQGSAASQPRLPAQQAAAVTQPRPAAQPSRPALTSGVPGIDISGEKIISGGKTFFMHEVQKGQTLYSIAKAYRVTILDIDRENSIPPGGIQAGQVLKIPASSALMVSEEQTPPSAAAATPDRSTAAAANASGGNTAAVTNMPRQETPRQETQLPRQETPRQETQLPRQETPRQETQLPRQEEQPAADTQQQAQQQTPSAGKSDDKPKPAQPEKKKIHKVQKGESLADIAKKYDITVQELKQANKGVIFAMPDMRLVIPVREEE